MRSESGAKTPHSKLLKSYFWTASAEIVLLYLIIETLFTQGVPCLDYSKRRVEAECGRPFLKNVLLSVYFQVIDGCVHMVSSSKPVGMELYEACEKGDVTTVERILKNCDYLAPDIINYCYRKASLDKGKTPLYVACIQRNVDIMTLLLERNEIDINMKSTNWGHTVLSIACQKGYNEIIMLIIKKKGEELKLTGNEVGGFKYAMQNRPEKGSDNLVLGALEKLSRNNKSS